MAKRFSAPSRCRRKANFIGPPTGKARGASSAAKLRSYTLPIESRLTQEDLLATNSTVRSINLRNVPCRNRNLGSLTYHLVAASRGSILASLSQWHKLYDVAGGLCLSAEAGCEARYLDGSLWQANVTSQAETRALLVAPPKAMQQMLEAFNEKGED